MMGFFNTFQTSFCAVLIRFSTSLVQNLEKSINGTLFHFRRAPFCSKNRLRKSLRFTDQNLHHSRRLNLKNFQPRDPAHPGSACPPHPLTCVYRLTPLLAGARRLPPRIGSLTPPRTGQPSRPLRDASLLENLPLMNASYNKSRTERGKRFSSLVV